MPSTTNVRKVKLVLADVPSRDEILFGSSAVMEDLRQRAARVSQTDVPALLHGDVGTGKEMLARWIHGHSSFAAGQFVKVNCSAIPGTLLESELFGYEQGAFTGARAAKPGWVELAHNGTLFLDGISECETSVQVKLLHFLQDKRFSRIGENVERVVNTRLICSTSRDLAKEIEDGRFRSDLFYRISVVRLRLPRLMERREDIPLIAEYLRLTYERQFAKTTEPFGIETLNYLQNLNWPGNLRELQNSIMRYVLIGHEAIFEKEGSPKHSPKRPGAAEPGKSVPLKNIANQAIREMERRVIWETLQENRWNRRKTAQALRISYRSLINKIRDAGLLSKRTASSSARVSDPADEFFPPKA